ncbi:c-type cytochrome biogenesis protein CcmI [Methylocella sp.]|uniref:c-type cytochrome biogenesis protein CcmI n=1 Tax=Methylocella sp. TaxID=1978226 RepID=UPI0037840BCA
MFWALLAIFSALATLAVAWPLIRPPRSPARGALEIGFYKAQLAEIERDAARGAVSPQEAQSAKAETARRLIAAARTHEADSAAPQAGGRASKARVAVIVGSAVCAPALALALYSEIGRPAMPDLPLSARMSQPPGSLDFMAAIGKIEAHLKKNPDDARGYDLLAPIYMKLGRYQEAAASFSALRRLRGDTPERLALEGEALVAAADGAVSDKARDLFRAAVEKDPGAARARFYLGVAAADAGDRDEARRIFGALLADAKPDAPYVDAVRARLAALDGAPPAASAVSPPVPSKAAEIAAMGAPEQATAIRGMVDRLAERLARDGGDVEGWLRLVRAYAVLQDKDKARSALADAKKNLAGDATASARIDALARELGLEG